MASCKCKTDIEAKLTERFTVNKPEATDHSVELQGYGFAVVGNTMEVKPFMNYKAIAAFPHKRGSGETYRSKTGMMSFSFCPFCGLKLEGGAA